MYSLFPVLNRPSPYIDTKLTIFCIFPRLLLHRLQFLVTLYTHSTTFSSLPCTSYPNIPPTHPAFSSKLFSLEPLSFIYMVNSSSSRLSSTASFHGLLWFSRLAWIVLNYTAQCQPFKHYAVIL